MSASYRSSIIQYFAQKAEKYDDVESQYYWRLSDAILWHIIETEVLPGLADRLNFLDAGCGTGRWGLRILRALPNARGTFADISPDMLAVCARKVAVEAPERASVVNVDLLSPKDLAHAPFNLSICFHNVLGFIHDLSQLISSLYEVTAKDGVVALMVPNISHAVYFSLRRGDVRTALNLFESNVGRFTDTMPSMRFFPIEEIISVAEREGFEILKHVGFPQFVYPDVEDTAIRGSSETAMKLLGNEQDFSRVLNLEIRGLSRYTASRGNNILLILRKIA